MATDAETTLNALDAWDNAIDDPQCDEDEALDAYERVLAIASSSSSTSDNNNHSDAALSLAARILTHHFRKFPHVHANVIRALLSLCAPPSHQSQTVVVHTLRSLTQVVTSTSELSRDCVKQIEAAVTTIAAADPSGVVKRHLTALAQALTTHPALVAAVETTSASPERRVSTPPVEHSSSPIDRNDITPRFAASRSQSPSPRAAPLATLSNTVAAAARGRYANAKGSSCPPGPFIFLGNLPLEVAQSDILAYFDSIEPNMQATDVQIHYPLRAQAFRDATGYAFVAFASTDTARRALRYANATRLRTRVLDAYFARGPACPTIGFVVQHPQMRSMVDDDDAVRPLDIEGEDADVWAPLCAALRRFGPMDEQRDVQKVHFHGFEPAKRVIRTHAFAIRNKTILPVYDFATQIRTDATRTHHTKTAFALKSGRVVGDLRDVDRRPSDRFSRSSIDRRSSPPRERRSRLSPSPSPDPRRRNRRDRRDASPVVVRGRSRELADPRYPDRSHRDASPRRPSSRSNSTRDRSPVRSKSPTLADLALQRREYLKTHAIGSTHHHASPPPRAQRRSHRSRSRSPALRRTSSRGRSREPALPHHHVESMLRADEQHVRRPVSRSPDRERRMESQYTSRDSRSGMRSYGLPSTAESEHHRIDRETLSNGYGGGPISRYGPIGLSTSSGPLKHRARGGDVRRSLSPPPRAPAPRYTAFDATTTHQHASRDGHAHHAQRPRSRSPMHRHAMPPPSPPHARTPHHHHAHERPRSRSPMRSTHDAPRRSRFDPPAAVATGRGRSPPHAETRRYRSRSPATTTTTTRGTDLSLAELARGQTTRRKTAAATSTHPQLPPPPPPGHFNRYSDAHHMQDAPPLPPSASAMRHGERPPPRGRSPTRRSLTPEPPVRSRRYSRRELSPSRSQSPFAKRSHSRHRSHSRSLSPRPQRSSYKRVRRSPMTTTRRAASDTESDDDADVNSRRVKREEAKVNVPAGAAVDDMNDTMVDYEEDE